jgi:hypothetical protein
MGDMIYESKATTGNMCPRAQQREAVEKVRKLTKQAKELRTKGSNARAASLEAEISGLKRELGGKPEKLTPGERSAKIKNIKERLKNASSR